MKRTLQTLFLFAATLLVATSCEKEIEVKLPEVEEKIVVEGWIEPDGVAHVILTRNSPYFEPVDSTVLAKLLVSNAVVSVSDGVNSEQLSLSIDPSVFPPLVYKGSSLKGQVGKRYTLSIQVDGKTLSASTTIPQPVPYDSVWFQLDQGQDSLGFIYARVTDPAGVPNYYRIFAKRIGRDSSYVPLLGSVYDDSFFDGISIDFAMARGIGAFSDDFEPDEEFRHFKLGDSVSVRSCAIDAEHHSFWRAIEKDIFTGGNPFVSPSSIPSNIKGGLGVWGGYVAQYVNMKLTITKQK